VGLRCSRLERATAMGQIPPNIDLADLIAKQTGLNPLLII
jgi:hypothetical protein